MEPAREEGLIHSGVALHTWHLLQQYEILTSDLGPHQKYEATLTLCALQSLSSTCWELYKYLDKEASKVLGALESYMDALLANPDVEVTNTSAGSVDAKAVVVHIRNALSHQRMKVTDPQTTGYTTIEDGSELVHRVHFCDSPDLNSKGRRRDDFVKRTGGDWSKLAVFTIEMPLDRLQEYTRELALVLAQPAAGNWDSAELLPLPA